jgi:hypothetical protein
METHMSALTRMLVNLVAIASILAVNALPGSSQSVPKPDHVVIVIEENHSYSEIIGNSAAPYINSLAQQGANFSNSFGVTHPSEPNYLALFSGSTQGVTDDGCGYKFSTPNLGRNLLNAAYSFTGYSEDLPSVGSTVCSFQNYWRKHNPWVNWQTDISPSPNDLPVNVNQPLTSFPADFTQLPTVSIVVPNQQNDMHDGTVQQADSWLQSHIGPYVQWAATHNSLLIVTWDEDDSSSGNHIPTIFVGPMVRPGIYSESINHYNVLRTLEDMYALPYAGQSANAIPITDVWANSAPVAPSNLTASAISSTQIFLTWTDNSADETGFEVWRSTNGGTFTLRATLGAGSDNFADSGLARNTRYYYKVRAFSARGTSSFSNTVSEKTPRK